MTKRQSSSKFNYSTEYTTINKYATYITLLSQDVERFLGEPIFVYYNGINHYDGLLLNLSDGVTSNQILQQLLAQQMISSSPTMN